MPRKSKIVAVPIDAPVAEPVEETATENKTDAEEMTNVIDELKTDERGDSHDSSVRTSGVDQPVVEAVAEPVAEPKPKRAPRAKAPSRKKVKELDAEVVAVEPSLEETSVVVAVPEEKPAAVVKDKVACPDCGKEMSAKTLKYSHAPNCVVKKKQSVEQYEPSDAKASALPPVAPAVSEQLIEDLVQQRLTNVRQERLARKQAMMEKLITGAF
jgi:hypothetical protein